MPCNSRNEGSQSVGRHGEQYRRGPSRRRKPHLRVPGYLYGAAGVVERVCGVFPNPEENAFFGASAAVQPLYRVRFRSKDIWRNPALGDEDGGGGEDTVDVEVYQHWLEAAAEDEAAAEEGAEEATAGNKRPRAEEEEEDHSAHSHEHGGSHTHTHAHGHAHGHTHGHGHDDEEEHPEHPHSHLPRGEVERTAVSREGPAVGPHIHCSPRHPRQCEPSSLE